MESLQVQGTASGGTNCGLTSDGSHLFLYDGDGVIHKRLGLGLGLGLGLRDCVIHKRIISRL